ncbi:hypothetical protein [Oceaniradius stylonematis]|uniref:hypothetical protein n=1 Tax=Oceaniradius stylonematis TaxID=2184161 RepID=UPI00273DC6CD|nr:hypothetical protein [Oceaniradius stylonematis]
MAKNKDFQRGVETAQSTAELADQATTSEVLAAGGPDFLAGHDTDEPPEWHRGWDWAIEQARMQ